MAEIAPSELEEKESQNLGPEVGESVSEVATKVKQKLAGDYYSGILQGLADKRKQMGIY